MKKSPFSLRSFLEDNFPMLPLALLSCMLFGIASYGVLLFQKLSVHDDIHYFFSVGATYSSGRWFLGLLGELVSRVFGSGHFSTSEWNGLLTLLFLGLTQGVLVSLLELKRKRSVVLACGILTVFPSICSLFGYAFTAPYYTFGYLLAALGVWLTTKKRWGYLGGIVLIACSTGIYQANFAFSLCLLLLVFLHRVAGAEHWTWMDLVRALLCNALVCALALGLYLAANTLAVKLSGTVLDSYMGISDMTSRGISVYLRRIRQALFLFLRPGAASRRAHAFPFQTLPLYYVTLVLDFLYALLLLYRARKSSPVRLLTLILGMATFPLAVNFIYVLSDFQDSHVLMVYCQAMVFVALCDQHYRQLFGKRLFHRRRIKRNQLLFLRRGGRIPLAQAVLQHEIAAAVNFRAAVRLDCLPAGRRREQIPQHEKQRSQRQQHRRRHRHALYGKMLFRKLDALHRARAKGGFILGRSFHFFLPANARIQRRRRRPE